MQRLKVLYLAASVSCITFFIYLFSLRNDFVMWDDNTYILNNPHIRSFNSAFWEWAFFDFYASNWHPLTWISHALDYAIWGLDPLGHHLTNNMLHSINTFLVVLLVVRLLASLPASGSAIGDQGRQADELSSSHDSRSVVDYSRFTIHDSRFMLIAAGVTGLLFGLHPIHVESVAWVAERKDVLCAFFFLLSMIMYTGYANSVKTVDKPASRLFSKRYLLAFAFFILALLSKPMAVSLPIVLLILDWYPFDRIRSVRTFGSVVAEKIPFIAGSLVSSVLTMMAQKAGGAMQMMEFVPLTSRMLVAAKSLVAYLWKMVLPLKLIPFYPYPKIVSFFSLEFFPELVLVIGITAACVISAKKQKIWLALWGYFIVTLVPVLGIVQVGGQSMADRYSYLPGYGPSLLIGLVMAWIYTTVHTLKKWNQSLKIIFAVAALFMFASMSYLTVKQMGIWRNDLALWNYIILREPEGVPMAYYNRGRLHQEMRQFDKALADCDKAIALNPLSYEAYNVRGSVYDNLSRFDKALADYDTAIALNPSYYLSHYNRGIVFKKLGRFDRAFTDYNRTIALNPLYYEAYVNRGNVLAIMEQVDGAAADYNTAITLDPFRLEAYINRAVFSLKLGDRERAVSDFTTACGLGDQKACDTVQALSHFTATPASGKDR